MHEIKKGQEYVTGHYLEKHGEAKRGKEYTINRKKEVFFFEDTIMHPFILFIEVGGKRKRQLLSNEDYSDLLAFLEQSKMGMLE